MQNKFVALKSSKQNRRKKKHFFPQIISLILIVLIAIGAIYFWYFYALFKSSAVLRPVPLLFKFQNSEDGTEKIKNELDAKQIPVDLIQIASDSSYFITLTSGEQILFSQQKNLDTQVASLQLILSRLTIEGKKIIRLDLRFDKPVITLK